MNTAPLSPATVKRLAGSSPDGGGQNLLYRRVPLLLTAMYWVPIFRAVGRSWPCPGREGARPQILMSGGWVAFPQPKAGCMVFCLQLIPRCLRVSSSQIYRHERRLWRNDFTFPQPLSLYIHICHVFSVLWNVIIKSTGNPRVTEPLSFLPAMRLKSAVFFKKRMEKSYAY